MTYPDHEFRRLPAGRTRHGAAHRLRVWAVILTLLALPVWAPVWAQDGPVGEGETIEDPSPEQAPRSLEDQLAQLQRELARLEARLAQLEATPPEADSEQGSKLLAGLPWIFGILGVGSLTALLLLAILAERREPGIVSRLLGKGRDREMTPRAAAPGLKRASPEMPARAPAGAGGRITAPAPRSAQDMSSLESAPGTARPELRQTPSSGSLPTHREDRPGQGHRPESRRQPAQSPPIRRPAPEPASLSRGGTSSDRSSRVPPGAPQSGMPEVAEVGTSSPKPPSPEQLSSRQLAALPGGEIAVALLELQRAGDELAQGFLAVENRERTRKVLGPALTARLERFVEGQGSPAARERWVQQDLVEILNQLAQLLSIAIEERRRGRGARQRVEDDLQRWLYQRLAAICKRSGWFEIEPILPYATAFNPRLHVSAGSRPVEGAENLVIGIRSIGRRAADTREILHSAEVEVGA